MTQRIAILSLTLVAAAALCLAPGRTRAQGASYLLVADIDNHRVLRYDASSGDFVDEFVPKHSGGLSQPQGMVFGPHDHDLYVGSGHLAGPGQQRSVLRFQRSSGAFLEEFVGPEDLTRVHGVTFGPDGHLYVGDWFGWRPKDQTEDGLGRGRILRFNGFTGAPMGEFVATSSGGLRHPAAHVFGPDGHLYVSDEGTSRILRYDGVTGASMGVFVAQPGAGLFMLTFGPDENLYVSTFNANSVLRFQGPDGDDPGAPLPSPGNTGADFIAAGGGGMLTPLPVLFGPDGNGDGHQDLYLGNIDFTGLKGKVGNVRRFDGRTGAFIDVFVPAGNGVHGLNSPGVMTFTETDPVTLAYTGP